ncbi:MAG TPA: 2-C-methyl-D-erythritol 4-phosphate cytidylyltransferase [Candidatus Choladousia intestinigallinarum]|nr:2-C-methyl-D-erythritol 4-phosphate cytidylyltransferase [Candidatus Choladousia intestinigallinarum]
MEKYTAVVLAAGSGSRMHSKTKKQYLMLNGKPVLYYSLAAFEEHPMIQEIILVCGAEDISWCRREIAERYDFKKIKQIVQGGKERYHSVYEGLKAAKDCQWVFIHDGARPMVDREILDRIINALPKYRACVVGMPVKDTIKRSDPQGFVAETLPREELWMIQTPQAFFYEEILDAYQKLMQKEYTEVKITDDAMVAEYIHGTKVKLIEGSYKNIKITTPEDLDLAAVYLR